MNHIKIMVEDFNNEAIADIEKDLDFVIGVSRKFSNKIDFTFFIDHVNKVFVDGKCRFTGFMNTIKLFKDFRTF